MADELSNAIDVIIKNLNNISTKDLENLSNKVEFELWERGLCDEEYVAYEEMPQDDPSFL